MTEKKKPRPEDFGWIDGGPTEPGGWQLEGGEEAYYEVLDKYEAYYEAYYEVLDKYEAYYEALDKYHMKYGILRNGNSLD